MTDALTDIEIMEVARGIVTGDIFCDWMVDDDDQLALIFPIVLLASEESRQSMLAILQPGGEGTPGGMIYEYYSEAAPLAANGYPMFFSCKFMGPDDVARVKVALKPMAAALWPEDYE